MIAMELNYFYSLELGVISQIYNILNFVLVIRSSSCVHVTGRMRIMNTNTRNYGG